MTSLAAALLPVALVLSTWIPVAGPSSVWSEPDWRFPDTELNEYARIAVDGSGAPSLVWYGYDNTDSHYSIWYVTDASLYPASSAVGQWA
ncbi:MAG: hypothetical protein QME88_07455 [Actinomycetota bacterium]|nr:hypothetical protein [Actinomycetota bacterium]